MRIRGIDVNNDWLFGKGQNDYARDLEALKIDLKTRLQSWKFDCFFAEQEGVDYKNFLDRGTKTFLDNDVKRIILQTNGVLRIDTFTSEIVEDRVYQAESNIFTIYGDLEFNFVQGGA